MLSTNLRPRNVIVFPAFCLASAIIASAILTHALDIVGFRAMPYVRLAVVGAAIVFVGTFLLQTRMRPRLAVGNLWRAVLALQLLGLVYLVLGLIRQNSHFYLATDVVYLLMFFLTFLLGAWCYRIGTFAFSYRIMLRVVLALVCITSFCWLFGLQVGTPPELLVLWGCVLIISMAYKKHFHSLVLLLAVVPQIAGINRALVLAVVGGLAIFFVSSALLKKVKVLSIVAIFLGVLVIVLNSLGTLEGSSFERRINETLSLLSDGDRDMPVALQQRFYEGQVVSQDLKKNTMLPVSLMFGLGAGYTLDMSQSIDSSVTNSQLLGEQYTHNIHFLSYALLARFGLLGALCFAFIFFTCVKRSFALFKKPPSDNGTIELLANLFVVLLFIFSAPASSFLFSSMLLGYFCGIANEARLTATQNRLLC